MELKKIFSRSALLLTLSIPVLFASCDKDDDIAASNTITDIVVAGASFTSLEAAVLKANLNNIRSFCT